MHHHRYRLPPLFWLVGLLLAELTIVATFAGVRAAALTPLAGIVAAAATATVRRWSPT